MSKSSRAKGAAFEREVAAALNALTGITFRRDLDQYRERERGDLLPDDETWPFIIECKTSATARSVQADWIKQAETAAERADKAPCVAYRVNRGAIRAHVPLWAVVWAMTSDPLRVSATDGLWIDVNLDGLAYLAREWTA